MILSHNNPFYNFTQQILKSVPHNSIFRLTFIQQNDDILFLHVMKDSKACITNSYYTLYFSIFPKISHHFISNVIFHNLSYTYTRLTY